MTMEGCGGSVVVAAAVVVVGAGGASAAERLRRGVRGTYREVSASEHWAP